MVQMNLGLYNNFLYTMGKMSQNYIFHWKNQHFSKVPFLQFLHMQKCEGQFEDMNFQKYFFYNN